jgi:hypothetical protein
MSRTGFKPGLPFSQGHLVLVKRGRLGGISEMLCMYVNGLLSRTVFKPGLPFSQGHSKPSQIKNTIISDYSYLRTIRLDGGIPIGSLTWHPQTCPSGIRSQSSVNGTGPAHICRVLANCYGEPIILQ